MINLKPEVMLTACLREMLRQMLALPAENEKTFSTFSPQCGAGGRTSGDMTNCKDNSGLFRMFSIFAKISC